jgi:hypothetical protein
MDVPLKDSVARVCDYCMSLSEMRQLTPLSEAMKFGYVMLVVGIVIGFLMPRVGVWIRDHIMQKEQD